MDKKWYEIVACLRYNEGKWIYPEDHPANPLNKDFSEKFQDALRELRYTASEAIEIFNHYSEAKSHVTMLILEEGADYSLNGMMLLRHASQIRLLRQEPFCVMKLIPNSIFQSQDTLETQFLAREDDMGTLVWCTEDGHIWDHEQLIKCALKELIKYS